MATIDSPTDNALQRFVFRCVAWDEYRAIADAIGERHVRIAYDGSNFEIMTVSLPHYRLSRCFCNIIWVLTEEYELPLCSAGSMTLNKDDVQRGIEPDECFYIDNAALIRGKRDIDLLRDPPPDLAVEIDVCRSSLDRLGIFAKIGIPEIWRCDGIDLRYFRLDEGGNYRETEHSRYFPRIGADQLMAFVSRRDEMDDTKLTKQLREWLREPIPDMTISANGPMRLVEQFNQGEITLLEFQSAMLDRLNNDNVQTFIKHCPPELLDNMRDFVQNLPPDNDDNGWAQMISMRGATTDASRATTREKIRIFRVADMVPKGDDN